MRPPGGFVRARRVGVRLRVRLTVRRWAGTGLVATLLVLGACHAAPVAPAEAPDGGQQPTPSPTEVPELLHEPSASDVARPGAENPFVGRDLYLPKDTPAAHAAASAAGRTGELLTAIAAVPTAVWLLPEAHPVGEVGQHVHQVVAEAASTGGVPVLVLYGIPDRDCISGHSRGGLAASEYVAWVREVAEAAGPTTVVVLEPDALASAGRCPRPAGRLSLLREAVEVLTGTEGGPATYIDAGHSDWIDAATTADRLRKAGVDRVRGFSLNVAGHGAEDDEVRFGQRVVDLLGSGHFVVDTGRAGAGSVGEWCNSAGRALGALPGAVSGRGPFDARLWVKPPGESDGTCGGGPPAGEFWPERAVQLAESAGW